MRNPDRVKWIRNFFAVLAAGWYMVVPNLTEAPPNRGWRVVDSFDTAEQCKDAIANITSRAKAKADARAKALAEDQSSDQKKHAFSDALTVLLLSGNARCIPTDDPRYRLD